MFSGQAAIDFLAAEAFKDDPTASFPWQKFHSEFKFNGQEFTGPQGFGGRAKQPANRHLWSMSLLQRRFRHFGDPYGKFNTIDELARKVTGKQNQANDLDVLRQTLTLSILNASALGRFTENIKCCTQTADYPWLAADQILVDGLCHWHQSYYLARQAFYKSYYCPIQHRLVTFHANSTKTNEQNI